MITLHSTKSTSNLWRKFNNFLPWLKSSSLKPSSLQSWLTSKSSNCKNSPVLNSAVLCKTKNPWSISLEHQTTNFLPNPIQGPKTKPPMKSTETTRPMSISTGTTNTPPLKWTKSRASNIPKLSKWVVSKTSTIECSKTEANSGMDIELTMA